jgi:hypothetical protein
MRLVALLFVLLSAGGAAFAQRGSDVILTKNQVRAMAPDAVTRRLFGGLSPLILPIPDRGQPGVRPTRPLRSLSFLTRPSSTNWDGICQSEMIGVEFEPAGPPAGADTRVRPRRFASETYYFVPDPARLRPERPPEDAEDEDPARRHGRWVARADAACTGVDPRRVQLINARQPYHLFALPLLLDLADDARAGRPTVPLDCSGVSPRGAPLGEAQCRARFAALRIGTIDMAADCSVPMAVVCHQISIGGDQIEMRMTPNNQRLASAKIEAMIVVADRLID